MKPGAKNEGSWSVEQREHADEARGAYARDRSDHRRSPIRMAPRLSRIDKGTEREDDLLAVRIINAATRTSQAYTGRLLKTRERQRESGNEHGDGTVVGSSHGSTLVTAVTKIEWRDSTGTATAPDDITGIPSRATLIVTLVGRALLDPRSRSPAPRDTSLIRRRARRGAHDARGICLRLVEIKRSDRTKHDRRGIEVTDRRGHREA